MAIPDYQTIMLPLLKFLEDEQEHNTREAINEISNSFKLTEDEKKELLPSGKQPIIDNRVGWARTYLKKAGLIESKRRGYFQISNKGLEILNQNPERIDVKFLNQFPEFLEFRKVNVDNNEITDDGTDGKATDTPEEALENSYQQIRDGLTSELLQIIKESDPGFFEQLVLDVLINMGYGGSRREAGTALGKSGDEGVDGIIKEDKLGLEVIYVQAKRWKDTVIGRPEIQKFAGALMGQKARKGIFLTTSKFSNEALEYVKHLDSKIILIDGHKLAELMIDNNVGVSVVSSYEVKKIDTDYFS